MRAPERLHHFPVASRRFYGGPNEIMNPDRRRRRAGSGSLVLVSLADVRPRQCKPTLDEAQVLLGWRPSDDNRVNTALTWIRWTYRPVIPLQIVRIDRCCPKMILKAVSTPFARRRSDQLRG